jgi:hypothetical protein
VTFIFGSNPLIGSCMIGLIVGTINRRQSSAPLLAW